MKRRKVSRGEVPYDRGLWETVRAKSSNGDWHQRGFLPHRSEAGLVQFVTFRLADSVPAAARHQIKVKADGRGLRNRVEALLDNGIGECHLRNPRIAEVVETALIEFHGVRYELRAWCLMPNHVHVLLRQNQELGAIVRSWKSFAARRANLVLGRTGSFWAPDYWDTFMRDEEQNQRVVTYIEENPLKAGLVNDASEFRWSSARRRDDYGRLVL